MEKRRSFLWRKWSKLDAFKLVKILPNGTDFFWLVGTTRDPNGNAFRQASDESGDSRRRQCHGIESDPLTASSEIRKKTILALEHVHVAVRPAELPFETLANSPQARRVFTKENRKVLSHFTQKNGLSDSRYSDDQNMRMLGITPTKLFDFFLAADKRPVCIHG